MHNTENKGKSGAYQKREKRSERASSRSTIRTIYRSDYTVHRTLISEILCGALAVLTTVLLWLFATPM
ncbi:MAG: hypothetical protein IJY04_05965 [Clostridia bacterium]|nr:hypothetical protein [Clostridia bacterium]